MEWFKDIHNRQIRFTFERREHIETDHPEMSTQIDKIQEALMNPDVVVWLSRAGGMSMEGGRMMESGKMQEE